MKGKKIKNRNYKSSAIFVIILLLFLAFSINSAAAACSGSPSCNYPNANSCNAKCGCAWSGTSCAAGSCSNCASEITCTATSGCTWSVDSGGTSTTTTPSSGGSGPTPVKVIFDNLQDGQTLKRGSFELIAQGFERRDLSSDLRVKAISDLFGTIILTENFKQKGSGIYGADIVLGKDIEAGTYEIIVAGEKEAYDEERIQVKIDPTIYLNATLSSSYQKGERIWIKGIASYFDGSPAKNIRFEAVISAGNILLNKSFNTSEKGIFETSYLVSFADPDGEWKIILSMEDKDGNQGQIGFNPKISTPAGVAFYTVTFLSPLTNGEYSRGEIIPLTLEVKEEGKAVEDAKVEFRDFNGMLINLNEVEIGTYSGEYKLGYDSPLGEWSLGVQAIKTVQNITRAGGNRIPVVIRPASLSAVLVSPHSSNFFTGQLLEIEAKIEYPQGSPLENGEVFFNLGNNTIKLIETSPGIYGTEYVITAEDATANKISLSTIDIYGNELVFQPKPVVIEALSGYELQLRLFYYNILQRYWYFFVLGIILIVLITEPLWYKSYLNRSYKKTIYGEKQILEMEKETQRKYFKDHSITREDYDKLMMKYRERDSDMKEKKLHLQKKLKSKKEKNNLKLFR